MLAPLITYKSTNMWQNKTRNRIFTICTRSKSYRGLGNCFSEWQRSYCWWLESILRNSFKNAKFLFSQFSFTLYHQERFLIKFVILIQFMVKQNLEFIWIIYHTVHFIITCIQELTCPGTLFRMYYKPATAVIKDFFQNMFVHNP